MLLLQHAGDLLKPLPSDTEVIVAKCWSNVADDSPSLKRLTPDSHTMLFQCWANDGPTLTQHLVDISSLLVAQQSRGTDPMSG